MKLEDLELLELTPAMLWLGPDVNGMAAQAQALTRNHGAHPADRISVRHLSAADARTVVNFAATSPFGPFKAVIACLDGASAQAQNILLKVLEEPPLLDSGEPAIRFILLSASLPLPTIMSRCQVITVDGEGRSPEPGQKVTAQVAAALNAAMAGYPDLAGLNAALVGWGDAHHSALCSLLAEAAAGRDPNRLLDRAQARRLLGALGRFNGAQPRLAAHAALITVLSDKEQHA